MFDFLIQWSSRYLQICFFIAFIMFDLIHVCSSSMYFLIHASLWCLLLYLHLTTHLSKYRYPLRWAVEVCMLVAYLKFIWIQYAYKTNVLNWIVGDQFMSLNKPPRNIGDVGKWNLQTNLKNHDEDFFGSNSQDGLDWLSRSITNIPAVKSRKVDSLHKTIFKNIKT